MLLTSAPFFVACFRFVCRFSFLPLPYRPAPAKALGCRLFSLGARCLISRAFNRTQSVQTNLASSPLWEGLRSLPRLLCFEPAVITHRASYLLAGLMEGWYGKEVYSSSEVRLVIAERVHAVEDRAFLS